MKRKTIIGGCILILCSSFLWNPARIEVNPAEYRYFKYEGDLYELVPRGEVKISNQSLTFINGTVHRRASQAEKDSLFPDSTSSADKVFKNDSWVKKTAYVPVSRNRWYLCQVGTLISGSSGQSLHEGKTGTTTYMFSRYDGPKAGLVRIKGTNICFILPP